MEEEKNVVFSMWNTRGLNDPARRAAVKIAVEEARASVVCLSESKLQSVTPFVIHECLGPRFDGFEYLPAVGTA
jgi:hypothetical protein